MRIGIIGSGNVGRALGRGFVGRGDDVKLGSREPSTAKLEAWAAEVGARGSTGSPAEAAAFGELLVLATAWSGTENALRIAGPANLEGKCLIDATNPLVTQAQGPPALALGHSDSGGEQVQRWAPGARVVKCFNIVGNAHMVKPQFPGGPPDMFFCGNDAEARTAVGRVCTDFGWIPNDIGGLDGARALEELAMLWIRVGFLTGGWSMAFKLLRT